MHTDSRLIIKLREKFSSQNKHLFILQKKTNLVLLLNVIIGKVAYINLGFAMIFFPGSKLEYLEENTVGLVQTFWECQAEQNEKWAKYLVKGVLKKIMILDGFINITTKMAKQAFEMSCDIKLKLGRWSIRPGEIAEEIIEAIWFLLSNSQIFV